MFSIKDSRLLTTRNDLPILNRNIGRWRVIIIKNHPIVYLINMVKISLGIYIIVYIVKQVPIYNLKINYNNIGGYRY